MFIKGILFILFMALALPGCTGSEPPARNDGGEQHKRPKDASYITIIAAGDNLVHDIIYNNARVNASTLEQFPGLNGPAEFDFTSCYEHIAPIIKTADIAFVNQETILGGKALGYSGYPSFNTPQETGLALMDAGFTVINHASNHTMDRGEKAVFEAMNFWDAYRERALVLGIFRSEEERKTVKRIVEKNGVRVGFLSYTYGLNGYVLPKDKPWLVAMIDKELMAREMDELRPLCDLLVVSMHWGNEFSHEPSETQRELAAFIAEHEADLIIGHHPHVTQPVEVLPRPSGKNTFCYYSLGDLLSHTQSRWTDDTITGALARIRVRKNEDGAVIETAEALPTVCHYGRERKKPFTVYPLWDYTEELAALHYKRGISPESLAKTAQKIFGVRLMTKDEFFSRR